VISGAQQRNGAVDSAAHRDRDASRTRTGHEDVPDRGCERLDGERLPTDRGSLEQGQTDERPTEPRRIRPTMVSPSTTSRTAAQSPPRVASPKTSWTIEPG
jgi:hypothetical protein